MIYTIHFRLITVKISPSKQDFRGFILDLQCLKYLDKNWCLSNINFNLPNVNLKNKKSNRNLFF